MSRVTCHVSRVTCHLSHVTCHMSKIFLKICKLLFFFFFDGKKIGQSGGASRWRVCYKRGLPRLVLETKWDSTPYWASNCIISLKVTVILLNRRILHIGGVALSSHFYIAGSVSTIVKRLKFLQLSQDIETKNRTFYQDWNWDFWKLGLDIKAYQGTPALAKKTKPKHLIVY